MSAWQRVIEPVREISAPSVCFRARTSATGSPVRIVEFCHAGSVIVELTTYFCRVFSSSETPVVSSVCCGQKPRKSSKVCRPSRIASQAALSRATIRAWSTSWAIGSNQSSSISTLPSAVMFWVRIRGRTGPPPVGASERPR